MRHGCVSRDEPAECPRKAVKATRQAGVTEFFMPGQEGPPHAHRTRHPSGAGDRSAAFIDRPLTTFLEKFALLG